MSDAKSSWYRILFGLQARRRLLEGTTLQLGGALCLAAQLYPHQLAAARRILTDLEVRHLLADEVGMGKTIQALMILNALRIQVEGLRTLILVPDELVQQWRDELRARAHQAPIDTAEEVDHERLTRLCWPGVLLDSDIDPNRYDFLIVDELPRYRTDIQARIARLAAEFKHILVLTSTPHLSDPERARELFQILEPTRTALAALENPAESLLESFRRREESKLQEAQLAGEDESGPTLAEVAQSHAALRRVVRARRDDYPNHFPGRATQVIKVEPLEAEVQRQNLLYEYLHNLGELSREFEPALLVQRLMRGRASFLQRLTYLRGHGHERAGILASISQYMGRERGDSRFDALCELLLNIWKGMPRARILLAAGDNLTVDDLGGRLKTAFFKQEGAEESETTSRADSAAALIRLIRNQAGAPESITDSDAATASAAQAFEEGTCQLLIAAEVGSVGLNLQNADVLIFYCLPITLFELEQWIGRVDRLGRGPAQKGKSVKVYALALRDLVDERLAEVVELTGVLQRSVSLSESAVTAIDMALKNAVLTQDPKAWRSALQAAQESVARSELDSLQLPLSRHLPWNAAWAVEQFQKCESVTPLEPAPVMGKSGRGIQAIEQAQLGWLAAMREAGLYSIRDRGDIHSLAYPDRGYKLRSATEATLVPLEEELIPRPWRGSVYYIARRSKLSSPPLRERVLDSGRKEPLHFLDHGSPLLSSLLGGWDEELEIEFDREVDPHFWLQVPPHHPAKPLVGMSVYLLIGFLMPDLIFPEHREDDSGVSADQRFIRALLPSSIVAAGLGVLQTASRLLSQDETWSLLRPIHGNALTPLHTERGGRGVQPDKIAKKQLFDRAQAAARQTWEPVLLGVEQEIAARCQHLDAEIDDLTRLMELKTSPVVGEAPARTRSKPDLEAFKIRQEGLEARKKWLKDCVGSARDFELSELNPVVLHLR